MVRQPDRDINLPPEGSDWPLLSWQRRGMALLDSLDAVPWAKLNHAYGPATDVPELLRALVDPASASEVMRQTAKRHKRDVRAHVIWTLWGNVYHQGTRWQVTSHVVPFLLEILVSGPRDPELVEFLLTYLHHIALGYPADMFPELVDPAVEFALADAAVEDAEDEFNDARMVAYARDCYRAVEAALPQIAPFANGSSDAVAASAIAILGSFRTDVARDALRDAVDGTSGVRRAIALVALAQLDAEAVEPWCCSVRPTASLRSMPPRRSRSSIRRGFRTTHSPYSHSRSMN
jgi:hypothetical protein